MKKFTIVCVRKNDSAYQPQVVQLEAKSADDAAKHVEANHRNYVVLAVFQGHHNAI